MRALIHRLTAKGVKLDDIASFIGSLANNMPFDAHITLEEINRRIRVSGWADIELDEQTFELTKLCFEVEGLIPAKEKLAEDTEKLMDKA
ncbi:MAG: hypothetical protein JRJ69_10740 [Deltaproteobacteria bacterium]|nr:hypothetical protein [Deltaproteobacteria bacterium]MBW1738004.1 hypothetical protein [Deltaproteobacteria bacterium]MBW1909779.1 hypothetical protein [Deltaproteobacteria bacterium]MBW2033909.1 hypothetical protein [Deltaproteobacteria bacterium]MBW2114685.1 hypothetical protein [Deltaproteobacteria bacterium]